ncbi:MAG TPA: hypothetical protein VD833_09630 [Vicinamibacterales bacterium]|nr:hypothetical protein [Vicinamibacterales bacterium]
MLTARTCVLASVAAGIALELGIQALGGRREAWDSPYYWTVGVPLAAAFAFALGLLSRGNAWVWTIVIVPSQLTAMMVRSGEISGLWPLMVVLGAVLSAPFVLAAFIGSRLRGARDDDTSS